MTIMIAYHGSNELKTSRITQVRAHREADQLIHSTYWENGKGCAVGCTVHCGDHLAYETELGIPQTLARLEDRIFESLPNGDSMSWPERFLEAIPVGADLSHVWDAFALWMLIDSDNGVIRFANDKTRQCILDVAALYTSKLAGDDLSAFQWSVAANAANDVAGSSLTRSSGVGDAWSSAVAASKAGLAQWSAATKDFYDAGLAAQAAVKYAADADSREQFWQAVSEKLLALLRAAPLY